ncbi:MAG: iron ABC transporter permease [Syntrophobacterales bacterium]|nr:iron ABC transporter permease [Syntrophobacterales bacterium]
MSLSVGAYRIPYGELIEALLGMSSGKQAILVWNIRLPRTVASLVVGAGLALAGLTLQSLLRNPLASPSTLGISQGAAFGAAVSVVVFKLKYLSITIFAFGGSFLATIIILFLGKLKRLTPESIILSGVALSSLFSAATVLIQYIANETELATIVFWTFGDVSRSNWQEIGVTAFAVFIALGFVYFRSWDFMAIESGEESAKGLGVSVERLRWQGMALVAIVSSVATAFHGVIAFVGLIAPHAARRLFGSNYSLLVPATSLLGALLLLGADTAGRAIIGSGGLPVGVITSFMGAPLFLYLLMRGYRR